MAKTQSVLRNGKMKLLFLIVLFLSQPLPTAFSNEAHELKDITLCLPWHHQFQFAGYYAALEQGYYRQAGFNVKIREGEPGVLPVHEVMEGKAQYGVGRSEIMLHYLQGNPVVALAPIFQKSAIIFLARKDSGITTPQDMIGRRVMLLSGHDAAEYVATFLNEGIDLNRLDIIPSTFDVDDLITGRTDVFNAYISNEPFALEERGIDASIIKPSTYGIDFYGDTLFTSKKEVAENPLEVKAFREATLKGWYYALAHKEEIIHLLKEKYQVGKRSEHLRFEADAVEDLIKPDLIEIGHVNPGRWQHIADTYVRLGMAEEGYSLDGFIYDPHPRPDYRWVKKYLLIVAVLVVLGGIMLLLLFNHRLNKIVAERTASLESTKKALIKSEKLYRIIFDKTPVGVGVISFDGTIDELNNKALEISGYSREEALSRNAIDLYRDPSDRDKLMEEVRKQGFINGALCKLKKKDGTPFDGRFTCVVVDVGGEKKMLSMLEDVTTEREMQFEKARVEAALQRVQKMEAIGLMAGGVAHDLNNILSGIVGYPELLLMQIPEDSPLRKSLIEIHKSGQRAAAVVADLLTVARGVASAKEPYNINTILADYLDSPECQELQMLHENITFTSNAAPDLANVVCSPVHVRKCIMNLIINAVEAIKGEGVVDIGTRNEYIEAEKESAHGLASGQYVVIYVSDNGAGISKKDQEHIFEPFYTRKVMGRSGTGLGLAVVWNTMQDHNGSIDVKSSEKGSVFELYFPTTSDAIVDEDESSGEEDLRGDGQTVLIIDDEPQQRDIASQMLEMLGYNVSTVASGEEALEYLGRKKADILLLDMIMAPGMNGRQAYEEILKIHPGQKAIISSGFSKNDEVEKTLAAGAGRFLKKPYTQKQLGRAVKKELMA